MNPSLPALWIQPRVDFGIRVRAHAHAQPLLPRLGLGQPDRADLRVGERDPRHGVVLRREARLTEDVGHRRFPPGTSTCG